MTHTQQNKRFIKSILLLYFSILFHSHSLVVLPDQKKCSYLSPCLSFLLTADWLSLTHTHIYPHPHKHPHTPPQSLLLTTHSHSPFSLSILRAYSLFSHLSAIDIYFVYLCWEESGLINLKMALLTIANILERKYWLTFMGEHHKVWLARFTPKMSKSLHKWYCKNPTNNKIRYLTLVFDTTP
jgi:hypothetical protein